MRALRHRCRLGSRLTMGSAAAVHREEYRCATAHHEGTRDCASAGQADRAPHQPWKQTAIGFKRRSWEHSRGVGGANHETPTKSRGPVARVARE